MFSNSNNVLLRPNLRWIDSGLHLVFSKSVAADHKIVIWNFPRNGNETGIRWPIYIIRLLDQKIFLLLLLPWQVLHIVAGVIMNVFLMLKSTCNYSLETVRLTLFLTNNLTKFFFNAQVDEVFILAVKFYNQFWCKVTFHQHSSYRNYWPLCRESLLKPKTLIVYQKVLFSGFYKWQCLYLLSKKCCK